VSCRDSSVNCPARTALPKPSRMIWTSWELLFIAISFPPTSAVCTEVSVLFFLLLLFSFPELFPPVPLSQEAFPGSGGFHLQACFWFLPFRCYLPFLEGDGFFSAFHLAIRTCGAVAGCFFDRSCLPLFFVVFSFSFPSPYGGPLHLTAEQCSPFPPH